MKVVTVIGTRPELIRLCRVLALLDEYADHIIVHTGQNYDYELNGIFYSELGIRKPDHFLAVKTGSVATVYGETLIKCETVFKNEKPDAVLILGDTNSSIAAIIAKRLKIPVYHMEAGNRCFDLNVPEEINRRIIDHIADFNLVYTEHARRNLLHEGMPARRIYLTGSPMAEILTFYNDQIEHSAVLKKLKIQPGKYFLVSLHREENVDVAAHLKQLMDAINALAAKYKFPVIFSTHPRTKNRIAKISKLRIAPEVRFMKPFGFFDYIKLQKNAVCTLSDSGTISEESAILNTPAITLRNAMERPEAMDAGTIILTGLDKNTILQSVDLTVKQLKKNPYRSLPAEYKITNVSERVVKLIMGTNKLSNHWGGIIKTDL